MKYKTYIQSLLTQERKAFTDEALERFPFIEIFKSVNGFDRDEVIEEFLKLDIKYHHLKLNNKGNLWKWFHTYGTLACWITKVKFLQFQISNKIPYALLLEDDLKISDDFFLGFDNIMKNKWHRLDEKINIIRLFTWGEGYLTSLSSAKRTYQLIKKNGVIGNIDDQFRDNCGPELKLKFNNYYNKLIETNLGDIGKTPSLDDYFYKSISLS